MKLKITCYTPKNQAAKCIKTQKLALLGITYSQLIIEQKVVNDHEFYWILDKVKPKELPKLQIKAEAGEKLIRKFYSMLMKIIARANKLAAKFQKATKWIKKFMVKRLQKIAKTSQSGEENKMIAQIEGMSDDEVQDFIKVHDAEQMREFLKGDLIKIEILED